MYCKVYASLGRESLCNMGRDVTCADFDNALRVQNVEVCYVKFMHHGKRRKLTCADFDNALRVQNVEVCTVKFMHHG